MKTALTIGVLLGLLAASMAVALWAWREIGAVDMGIHGLVALGLGAIVTLLLGAGLMTLMFFSARRGYDDRVHDADDVHPNRWHPPGQD